MVSGPAARGGAVRLVERQGGVELAEGAPPWAKDHPSSVVVVAFIIVIVIPK